MHAFVTGSTGLVGSNLVRLLIAQGHTVKALARSREKAERLLGDIGAEIVIGDMENVAGFAPALAGCDVLFHTAAYFREYYSSGDHWAKLERINVTATIELLTAAEQHGIQQAIHTSSSGVLAASPDGSPADESAPVNPFADENLYFKSKVLAEQAIAEFLQTHDLPVVLILPGWILGPGDAGPTGSGRLILQLIEQKLRAIPPGARNMVDARDVAQAMINAVERGLSGERYIVGGEQHTLAALTQEFERVTGIPAPTRRVPFPILLIVARIAQTVARLRGEPSLLTVAGLRTMRDPRCVTSARAIRELAVTFRPLAETLRDEVAWFHQQRYTKVTILPPRDRAHAPA